MVRGGLASAFQDLSVVIIVAAVLISAVDIRLPKLLLIPKKGKAKDKVADGAKS